MTDRVTGWLAAIAGAGAVLAAMTALSAPAALAQATTENPQQARVAPPRLPAADMPGAAGVYDGRTLDAFARATRIVGALRNEYSPKIAAANIAGRPERAEALFDEMRARMHDAIDATGLTIETYEAIAARAEHDRALRARIEAIMTGARPPADPGLGVQAPPAAPGAPVSRGASEGGAGAASDGAPDALAVAKAEIEALHRRLDTERSRARADRERAAADAVALRRSLEGAIARLAEQMERGAPAGEIERLRVELMRERLARAALLRDVTRLSRTLASTGAAMAALGEDLAATPAPEAMPLARARPVLLGGSLPSLAGGLTSGPSRDVLRARLDAAQTRNLTLRAHHASERVALRREIDRVGRDLATATAALRDLGGGTSTGTSSGTPTVTAAGTSTDALHAPDSAAIAARAVATLAAQAVSDPMHDREVYAIAAPAAAEAVTPEAEGPVAAPPAVKHPAMPAAPVVRNGSLQAGIRAYESRDYARAYQVWQPLAEAGNAAAQFHLGALYFEGRGVDRDLDAARRWLRRALARGDERARFLLGRVETQRAKTG